MRPNFINTTHERRHSYYTPSDRDHSRARGTKKAENNYRTPLRSSVSTNRPRHPSNMVVR